jgi:hypothetical protein
VHQPYHDELARNNGFHVIEHGDDVLSFACPKAHVFRFDHHSLAAQSFDPARGGYHGPFRIYQGAADNLERALFAENPGHRLGEPDLEAGWMMPPSRQRHHQTAWFGQPGQGFIGEATRLFNHAAALGWTPDIRSIGDSGTFRAGELIAWWTTEGWRVRDHALPLTEPFRHYGFGYSALLELLESESPLPKADRPTGPQAFTETQADELISQCWMITPERDYAQTPGRVDAQQRYIIAAQGRPGNWALMGWGVEELAVSDDPLELSATVQQTVAAPR